MDLIAYLRVFQRRWPLLVVPALGAMLVAWVTLPEQNSSGAVVRTYSATATIISSPSGSTFDMSDGMGIDLNTVALFATVGEVPRMAARLVGYEGEPQVLASQVAITPASETSTLTISSTDPEAQTVARRVNAFADATIAYFSRMEQEDVRSRIRALERQLDSTARQMERVQLGMSEAPGDPILEARLAALQSQYSSLFGGRISLTEQLGGGGPLEILQRAVPIPQVSGGFTTPTDPAPRLGIAALLGLLLGAALALVVERLDSRMRTREQVEDAFGLPVLAEVPALAPAQRKERRVVSAERPASTVAEAYRTLRSSVLLLRPDSGQAVAGTSEGRAPLVVLVTSALPGEGKTTTVANLAAVMAEAGRRVLTLSFDLRNPKLHEYFDVADGTGMSDLLAGDRPQHLEQVVRDTRIPGVTIATSGQELGHPGALLASAGPLIAAARGLADVVLIDTAPLLAVSDAIDLAQHVDVALVVTRLNRTTTGHAAAAQRLLSRLGVPALGTVLVGSRPTGAQEGYLVAEHRQGRSPLLVDSIDSIDHIDTTDAQTANGLSAVRDSREK